MQKSLSASEYSGKQFDFGANGNHVHLLLIDEASKGLDGCGCTIR